MSRGEASDRDSQLLASVRNQSRAVFPIRWITADSTSCSKFQTMAPCQLETCESALSTTSALGTKSGSLAMGSPFGTSLKSCFQLLPLDLLEWVPLARKKLLQKRSRL